MARDYRVELQLRHLSQHLLLFEQAAAVMLQGMTAHYLAHSAYSIGRGDEILIHAGAGGVGLLLTQVAKSLGARVLVTVSSEEKGALCRDAGADEVILYTQVDFAAEVQRLTAGRGLAVVYDAVERRLSTSRCWH